MSGPEPKLVLSLVSLALAVALAACGGSDSDSGGDGSGGSLTLVAYSTPQEAYEEIIPAFNKTPEGKGVSFEQSYGASGDQARAIISGLEADVAALSLEPDVTKLVDEGLVADGLEPGRVRRLRDELGGGLRGPQGQPEEHPDLGRPRLGRRRDHHAEPVHLGRRAVEPDGRLRRGPRAGQVRGGGARLPQADPRQHAGPGQVGARGAADVRRRQGRRAPRLRERGDHRPAEGRGRRLRRPRRDDPDREPGRGARRTPTRRRRPSATSSSPRRRSGSSSRRATARCSTSLADEEKFPTPAKLFEIDKFGGWDKVRAEFFDPENGSVAQIEEEPGGLN